jgi:polysaccharide export outer membrane protein
MKFIFCTLFAFAVLTAGVTAQAPDPAQSAPAPAAALPAAMPSLASPKADTPGAAPATSSGYVLRSSDAVQVTVYREPDLTTLVRLAGDGSITFPLIGRVVISGMTVQQAQDTIAKRLGADYLVNPHVTMTVVEYTKQYFTVLGQVQRPGAYELPGDAKLSLLQGIGMAGGFTRLANTAHVVVKRKVGNEEKIIKVNAVKLANENSGEAFLVQIGDTISVPESLF